MLVSDIITSGPLFEDSTVSKLAVDTTLAEPGKSITIGPERETRLVDNISVLRGGNGSYRLIYRVDGKIISGLQIMSSDGGKTGIIANVYTLSKYRREGLAKQLLNAARTIFVNVKHSESVTDLGKKFKSGTG